MCKSGAGAGRRTAVLHTLPQTCRRCSTIEKAWSAAKILKTAQMHAEKHRIYICVINRENLYRSALKWLRTSHLTLLMTFDSKLLKAHFTVSGNQSEEALQIRTSEFAAEAR